jgi:hypothetical protein
VGDEKLHLVNGTSMRGSHEHDVASSGVVWPTTFDSARRFLLSFGRGEKEGKGIECVVDSAKGFG